MSKYYFLSGKHKAQVASAVYEIEDQIAYELIPLLKGKQSLPFNFKLKRIIEGKSDLIIDDNLDELEEIWLDYLPNSFVWPLMSEKLRFVVQTNLVGNEHIDWISCKVKSGNEERTYYILRFNNILDVLNMQKTSFVQGTDVIIKPVFSSSKINRYTIFSLPLSHDLYQITSGLYLSEKLKKEIEKEKLTGLDFSKVPVV
ncbi:imm11 family protein [Flavobacterium collinsii]|uniref:imm11 family protein n=1 Tax=Flavobacterium collinsii TaxID=1114861 RepID=UPI003756DD8D